MSSFLPSQLGRLAELILVLSRPVKRLIVLMLDVALCLISVWLSFYLRLGEFFPLDLSTLWPSILSVLIAIPLFITSGLYRAIFRYSGLPAMLAVGRAMVIYGLIFASIFTFWGMENVPRTVGLIQPMVLFFTHWCITSNCSNLAGWSLS